MAAIAALSASAAAPQAERKTDSLHIASLSPREAATIDSIVAMRLRLQPKQIESIFDTNDAGCAIDTLDYGQRRHTGGALQQQHVEIRPQPRDSQGQHHLREILGYDNALPLQGGGHVVDAQIGGHRPGGLGHELPLPLPGFGAPAWQIRPAAAAPASGRRPAAQGGRPGLRHVLRPRAYFGI